MISDKDKKSIENIARKYHASNVVLFGSSISETAESRDIDIAVEVIPDKEFLFMPDYRLRIVSKPVDVVDLSRKTKFIDLVIKEGISLYA
jgi:predicted nucleotidyltransferase